MNEKEWKHLAILASFALIFTLIIAFYVNGVAQTYKIQAQKAQNETYDISILNRVGIVKACHAAFTGKNGYGLNIRVMNITVSQRNMTECELLKEVCDNNQELSYNCTWSDQEYSCNCNWGG